MYRIRISKFFLFIFLVLLITLAKEVTSQNCRQQLQKNGIFLPEIAILRQQIYKNAPLVYKGGIYKDMTYYHAAIMASETAEELYSGNYYTNWSDLEQYLYQIFYLIAPPELRHDSIFKIIIKKDGDFNAYMTPSGLMAINVGLFDIVKDESILAGIMAHELSHFILNHSLRAYISYRTGEFNRFLTINEGLFNRYSSKLEYQADSMAVVLVSKSPYSINGLIEAMDCMCLVDSHQNILSSEDIDDKINSHPSSKDRKDRLLGYCRKYDINKGSKFIVSKEFFNLVRQKAKNEILICLLDNFKFEDCSEKAFKYHLLDPSNSLYVRYIAESIRRSCYGKLDNWNKMFITSRYYDTISDGIYKKEMKNPLVEKFNASILLMSQEEIDSIKALFYWDGTIRFSTNEEAFNYFVKIGKLLKDPEIFLINALSYTKDTVSRNIQLQKYLSCENIKYPQYAHYLLKDSLEIILPPKSIVVLDNVETNTIIGKYEVGLSTVSFDTSFLSKRLIDSLSIKEDSGLYLPELKRIDLNKYMQLQKLMILSFWPTVSFGEPVNLYILEPEFWYLLEDMDINQIDFISCLITQKEKYSKNPEQYWQAADQTIYDVLNSSGKLRYTHVALSHQDISKEQRPRTNYFKFNLGLSSKKDGLNALKDVIKSQRHIYQKEYRYVTTIIRR